MIEYLWFECFAILTQSRCATLQATIACHESCCPTLACTTSAFDDVSTGDNLKYQTKTQRGGRLAVQAAPHNMQNFQLLAMLESWHCMCAKTSQLAARMQSLRLQCTTTGTHYYRYYRNAADARTTALFYSSPASSTVLVLGVQLVGQQNIVTVPLLSFLFSILFAFLSILPSCPEQVKWRVQLCRQRPHNRRA